jgi:DNA mismatch repair protein MutL
MMSSLDATLVARYAAGMSSIRVLPVEVANLIAAGEVVERPASVVKELVENALDAEARSITVDLQNGGVTRIQVSDDGCGMGPEDLAACILPHATSKISSADDLAQIATLGFRGEALPSIAAVSRLLITSKTRAQTNAGCICVDAGKIGAVEPCSAPDGTLMLVENLFANTPARQKFLKTERTEYGHIYDLILRMALANPDVRFVLRHQGKETLRTTTTGDLRGRIAELLSVRVAEQLILFSEDSGGVQISGFAGRPSLAKTGTPQTYLSVNGRVVRDRLLMHAVSEAFRTHVPRDEYPFCVVALAMPSELVDVNVHPAKAEVRFAQPQAVHQLVVHTVRAVLQSSNTQPMTIETPVVGGTEAFSSASPPQRGWNDSGGPGLSSTPGSPLSLNHRGGDDVVKAWPNLKTPELFSETDTPRFRPLGQLARTYLLYEAPDGDLLVIDQHAAHERLGYLQLKSRFEAGGVAVQQLLIPVVVELSPRAHAAVIEHAAALTQCGLDVENFGGNAVVVKSVPALLAATDPARLIQGCAEDLAESGNSARVQVELDHVLMTMACHRQVRAGDYLTPEELGVLAKDVMTTPTAERCPHGRPTWVRVPKSEIEKWFARR